MNLTTSAHAVELNPGITQRELAKLLGVSNGKPNYLIAALIEKGLIKMGNFQQGKGKLNKTTARCCTSKLNPRWKKWGQIYTEFST